MSKIHIPTPLRQYVGKQSTVDVKGATVGAAMGDLLAQHPELRRHLMPMTAGCALSSIFM